MTPPPQCLRFSSHQRVALHLLAVGQKCKERRKVLFFFFKSEEKRERENYFTFLRCRRLFGPKVFFSSTVSVLIIDGLHRSMKLTLPPLHH